MFNKCKNCNLKIEKGHIGIFCIRCDMLMKYMHPKSTKYGYIVARILPFVLLLIIFLFFVF